MIAIEIADRQRAVPIDPGRLRGVVRAVLGAEGIERASISVALVDNPTIEDLNARFLGHTEPTDVLSFPLSEPGDAELAGEVVISGAMAVAVAQREGLDPRAEVVLYLVHGLLHLCGYDDRDPAGRAAMRRREAEVLDALHVEHRLPPGSAAVGSEPGEIRP